MGGTLEFIQSFNNPKIIDAPDSSLQEGKLHSGWKPFIIVRALLQFDRILSTNPGAEPPGDARDSGSARSHSTHLETSSSDRP